ncbi:MAG: sugar phosphate isomerase/epimerase family protein [Planctomycetota bacterium]
MTARIGACSWSLRPQSADDLLRGLDQVGVSAVQLALDPLRTGAMDLAALVAGLERANIEIASGMMMMAGEDYSTIERIRVTGGVRLDATFAQNLAAASVNALIARDLGIELVSFHAGFIPHDPRDPLRQVMLDRLRQVIERFTAHGLRVAFETGQESAETLVEALDALDMPAVGVNFDPANMILYGMGRPIQALETLASRVVQVHLKDACASSEPGRVWGQEVPVGVGEVDWPRFFEVLARRCPQVDWMIEREAGDDRVRDMRTALEFVSGYRGRS